MNASRFDAPLFNQISSSRVAFWQTIVSALYFILYFDILGMIAEVNTEIYVFMVWDSKLGIGEVVSLELFMLVHISFFTQCSTPCLATGGRNFKR